MSDDGRCSYVLPKKKRRCRMLVKSGKRFCGEHAIVDPDNKDRVPCPNDPNHTVAVSELEVHLQSRCNSRLPNDPWIQVNLNSVQNTDSKEFLRPETEDVVRVSNLIEKAYDALPTVKQVVLQSDLIEEHLKENEEFGPSTRKHLLQQSSIIGHLQSQGLLTNETGNCVVELGSGKAQLAYWMAKTAPNCRFLLIDKMGTRNKHDNKALQGSSSLTAVCKHFCGSATDCGIRCLHNAVKNGFSLDGFALAPCCHHKCSFSEYVGHSYLSSVGICDEKAFAALRHISTWALCGFPQTEMHCSDESDDVKLWSKERKEVLGRKSKVILEHGRAEYMRSLGFTVELLKYVPSEISPENILMRMDCFAGASTGAFKTIHLKDGSFANVTPVNALSPKQHGITAMCFSGEDQTEVLAAQLDRQLNLYNGLENTYTGMFAIEGGEGAVKGLQMTQSGNIISGVESGEIRIWEPSGGMLSDAMNAGKNLLTLRKHPTAEVVATGGHENPLKLWDLGTEKTTFTAKNVRPDHLELRVPVWVTNVRFLGDGQCIVTTTGKHQIRLYDPRAQRRPVKELEWLEEPINALSTCHRPEHVLAGNTRGELGIFDLRGKISLASKYRGFAGAIRSIDAHPSAPYAASCGADRFVLVHNLNEASHKPMKKIYCKVQLNSILMRNENSLVSPTKAEAKDEIVDELDQRPKPRNKLGSAGSDDSSEDEALWNDMKIVGQTKSQRKRAEVKEEPADDAEPLPKHAKVQTRNKRKDSLSEADDVEVVPVKKHRTDRTVVKKGSTNVTRSKRRSESTLSEDSDTEETQGKKAVKLRKKSRRV